MQNASEETLAKYIDAANNIFEQIDDYRSSGAGTLDHLESLAKVEAVNVPGAFYSIPLAYDHHYDGDYAAGSIKSIHYYNNEGQCFKVNYNKKPVLQ